MQNKILTMRDIIALSFMILALFLGAGNIIYPPLVGKVTNEYYLFPAIGFGVSGVLLPMLAVIVLAEKKGDPLMVCAPLGKLWGPIFASSFYVFLGVLFASPRTATVSYEMGVRNFVPNNDFCLLAYTALFFVIVWLLGLHPHSLLKTIGYVLAPLKILCLVYLAGCSIYSPVAPLNSISGAQVVHSFSEGMVNGYLTMDTLSAMTVGIIVINCIKLKGGQEQKIIIQSTKISVLIAGIALMAIYICLIKIGAGFRGNDGVENGAQILRIFVADKTGGAGTIFMTILLYLACTVTAIGLTSSTATLFSHLSGIRYNVLLSLVVFVSFLIANFGLTRGLTRLIEFSIPVLSIICPACTTLILLTLFRWPLKSIAVPVWTSIIFSFYDVILKPHGFVVALGSYLPFSDLSLGWIFPTVLVAIALRSKYKCSLFIDRDLPPKKIKKHPETDIYSTPLTCHDCGTNNLKGPH